MNRDYTVLGNGRVDPAVHQQELQAAPSALARPGKYSELLTTLFQHPSAVAVTACGADIDQSGICEGIASELAASGKKVVVVPVDRLLLANPIRVIDDISLLPGATPNVWVWPSIAQQLEVFSPRALVEGENWLIRLRRGFHTVILDCPPLESAPEVCEFSAIVDSTLLVIEAERTTKQQIQKDQHVLRTRGINLAGCILVRGKMGSNAIS